eukprot:GHVS01067321.1.p1 GENE.GHVS01067321.1~~GHVS01067321.1.p1  ORF type:complete len:636 (+),score=132.97 GHVS01067321.1:560-2467(+)
MDNNAGLSDTTNTTSQTSSAAGGSPSQFVESEGVARSSEAALPSAAAGIALQQPSSSGNVQQPYGKRREDYEFHSVLGSGAMGRVYLAKSLSTNDRVAIKVVSKNRIIADPLRTSQVFAERASLKILDSPYICRLHCTFQDDVNLYFVLEMGGDGTLAEQLQRWGGVCAYDLAQFFTAELVGALGHLRLKGVVHGDLKPQNILVTNKGHLKVIDFNSAKIMPRGMSRSPSACSDVCSSSYPSLLRHHHNHHYHAAPARNNSPTQQQDNSHKNTLAAAACHHYSGDHHGDTTSKKSPVGHVSSWADVRDLLMRAVGSTLFLAPELLGSVQHSTTRANSSNGGGGGQNFVIDKEASTGLSTDLWSLGCIVYQMLAGKSPFLAETEVQSVQRIRLCNYSFPQNFPPLARDFVARLLVPDPALRLGANALSDLLTHPFISDYSIATLYQERAPASFHRLSFLDSSSSRVAARRHHQFASSSSPLISPLVSARTAPCGPSSVAPNNNYNCMYNPNCSHAMSAAAPSQDRRDAGDLYTALQPSCSLDGYKLNEQQADVVATRQWSSTSSSGINRGSYSTAILEEDNTATAAAAGGGGGAFDNPVSSLDSQEFTPNIGESFSALRLAASSSSVAGPPPPPLS